MSLDVLAIRRQFPLLQKNPSMVYLDSAATSQKPQAVLDAMNHFYTQENGNANRGMHPLAEAATARWEDARKTVVKFLNAESAQNIVFTKSATEALNLVARSLSEGWEQGDIVVLSILEHHSNIIPWMQLKQSKGIEIQWIHCNAEGKLNLDELDAALATDRVKLVSITAQSNVLGVRPDVEKIIERTHNAGALVCIDAAQRIAHGAVDVQKLNCDFLVFSGHKLYGPTGIGVLFGKKELLASMSPFLGGGGMIQDVSEEGFIVADLPEKFEAGTLPIAEAVGLEAAINWLSEYSQKDLHTHEAELLAHACTELQKVSGLHILGPVDPRHRYGCISFTIDGVHPHDLTDIIGKQGFCLRAGHLCAAPLHKYLGIPASSRISVALYNTKEEITACVGAIEEMTKLLRK